MTNKDKIIVFTTLEIFGVLILSLIITQAVITFRLYRNNYDCEQKLHRALDKSYLVIEEGSSLHEIIPYFIEKKLYPSQFRGIIVVKDDPFSDKDLDNLYKEKVSMKELDLNKSPITSKGIAGLAKWDYLKWLDFSDRNFSTKELRALKELKQVEILGISNSNLTNKDKFELQKALPNCEIYIYKQ